MPWPIYPFVINVPHGSTYIPTELREAMLLTDDELKRELGLVTDLHMGELAEAGQPLGMVHRFRYSRLVVDPERDRHDPSDTGPVPTRTSTGQLLRRVDDQEKERLLVRYYDPHQASFESCLSFLIKDFGWCLLINLYSFTDRTVADAAQRERTRPGINLYSDPVRTPARLAGLVEDYWHSHAYPVFTDKLSSTIRLPERYRPPTTPIQSIDIEVKRCLYLDEITGDKLPAFQDFKSIMGGLFDHISREYLPDLN